MTNKCYSILLQVLFLGILSACQAVTAPLDGAGRADAAPAEFSGPRAYQDLVYQVNLGPRIPGTEGHRRVLEWMERELEAAGWIVEIQQVEQDGITIKNLIASRGGAGPYWLLGAHYDSRILADQDPEQASRGDPVPGANDGASGVAVLLELARVLPVDLSRDVRLVFFDAEDNGGIGEWDWILGSRAYVQGADALPELAVIVDMVGDADLQLYYERNSDPEIAAAIWETAAALGHGDVFIPRYEHSLLDDHTPFLEAGIPAVDIIDFDYIYWHTTQDTADKTSPESLEAVGSALAAWLQEIE